MSNIPAVSNEKIYQAVCEWEITLSEIFNDSITKIDKTLNQDIPYEALPMISKLKEPLKEFKFPIIGDEIRYIGTMAALERKNKKETQRLSEVEIYLKDTSQMEESSNIPKIIIHNSTKYFSNGHGKIYKVIEHKWNTCICYNPLNQAYSVHDILDNRCLIANTKLIEKTKIEWYYKIDNKDWTHWYYFIWENWTTQYFWDLEITYSLKKYKETICIDWEYFWEKSLKIIKWDKSEVITNHYIPDHYISKGGKNLLYINIQWKYSLFNLDEMKYIFKNATDCNLWIEWWKIGSKIYYSHKWALWRYLFWPYENNTTI